MMVSSMSEVVAAPSSRVFRRKLGELAGLQRSPRASPSGQGAPVPRLRCLMQGHSEGRAAFSGTAPSGAVGEHRRWQGRPLIVPVVFHFASCCLLVQLGEVR